MRILFLTSAHNSLSQRAFVELTGRGHAVAVAIVADAAAMHAAVDCHRPDLIVAPMLTRAIPEAIWRRHPCLIVHPGPPGDRGPAALDWAIQEGEPRWGVTVLQATAELDAGPVWAAHEFPARPGSKSSLYRDEVAEAAMRGLREAVARVERGGGSPAPPADGGPGLRGRPRPAMTQADRRIDWAAPTEAVLRRLWGADGRPGVRDRVGGLDVTLYGGEPEDHLRGRPGALLATHDGAICRATGDGAVWIPSLQRRREGERRFPKLPATLALGRARLAGVPARPLALEAGWPGATYRQIRYAERGPVGLLHFAFPNGAMSADQCRRLRAAVARARRRPTRVLVLLGGPDYFSNGIHLNVIEAAPSPANAAWRNLSAMNDLVHDLITLDDKLVVAALAGGAGAGGAVLALAADEVWARPGVVLNPHYQGMGGLYGSEYWTYLLPRRVGARRALELTEGLLPVGAGAAQAMGLIDAAFGAGRAAFLEEVAARADALAAAGDYAVRLAAKAARRRRDEAAKPLAAYRAEELAHVHRSFFGPDPAFHEARYRFVHKLGAGAPIPGDAAPDGPSRGGRGDRRRPGRGRPTAASPVADATARCGIGAPTAGRGGSPTRPRSSAA